MLNVDYRISGLINYRHRALSLQLKVYHQSSHLADDYILRMEITTPNPGTMNYEQVDLLGSWDFKNIRFYGGLGYVYNPNNIRKRLNFQSGTYYVRPCRRNEHIRFVAGADIKIQEQHQFRPNFRSAVGIEVGSPDRVNLGFFLEYYNGHLPYSVLEYNVVEWIGISTLVIMPSI